MDELFLPILLYEGGAGIRNQHRVLGLARVKDLFIDLKKVKLDLKKIQAKAEKSDKEEVIESFWPINQFSEFIWIADNMDDIDPYGNRRCI